MSTSLMLSAALTLVGGGPDLRVQQSPDATSIEVLDGDGEVSAEIVVWVDGDGGPRLDAAWPDGLHLGVRWDGDGVVIDTDDAEEVARRWASIQQQVALPGWSRCVGAAVLSVGPCGAGVIPFCAGAVFLAACECIEHFTEGEHSCFDE